jgi:glycosyltransferase involved in cell wall biosynthesis
LSRDLLRAARHRAVPLAWRLLHAAGLYRPATPPVAFVVENADWAIRWVGEHVRDEANRLSPGTVAVTVQPERQIGKVVHFGSQYMWLTWGRAMSPANRYVTSFFHGKPEDGPDVARHIDQFLGRVSALSRIVASNSLVEARLLSWGVPRGKVVRIPIGTDTNLFRAPSAEERRAARARFGIPDHAVAVGSFQKDGVGWGDGSEPKLIKGPDVFVAAIERLAKQRPVFVVLTGPARGYVRAGLDRIGVPYAHTYAPGHDGLVPCYHALDLYFVTSREEGGPMGLMESMASGVPVVSTAVGMAPDLIEDGVTGAIVASEDVEALARRAMDLLDLPDGGAALRSAARQKVMIADWSVVGRAHLEQVYRPLL